MPALNTAILQILKFNSSIFKMQDGKKLGSPGNKIVCPNIQSPTFTDTIQLNCNDGLSVPIRTVI